MHATIDKYIGNAIGIAIAAMFVAFFAALCTALYAVSPVLGYAMAVVAGIGVATLCSAMAVAGTLQMLKRRWPQ